MTMILTSLLISTAFASEGSLNIFEGSRWRNKSIRNLKASMIINSEDEIGIRLRITTLKRGAMPGRCSAGNRGKHCDVMSITEYPSQLSYDPSNDLVYFGQTICAEVRDRGFWGREIVLMGDCELSVKRSHKTYKVQLVDKSL